MYGAYKTVRIPETNEVVGTGWLPPLPHLGDYTEQHAVISKITKKLNLKDAPKALPPTVDLRQWCSPIENQGGLGSCSAHAIVGAVEYFERRAFNKYIDGSRLFVYKTTRDLMKVTGDTGAWLRDAMKALVLCGIPDEQYWPYTDDKTKFDAEPSAFVYAIADDYEATAYFRHDPHNTSANQVITSVKTYISRGIPSVFGFFGFPSFGMSSVKGGAPLPCPGEGVSWGHAVVAVGYDDSIVIKNTKCPAVVSTGAFLFRNSWGTSFGDNGYGWIPYDYVTKGYALDFWSLLNMKWVDTGNFAP